MGSNSSERQDHEPAHGSAGRGPRRRLPPVATAADSWSWEHHGRSRGGLEEFSFSKPKVARSPGYCGPSPRLTRRDGFPPGIEGRGSLSEFGPVTEDSRPGTEIPDVSPGSGESMVRVCRPASCKGSPGLPDPHLPAASSQGPSWACGNRNRTLASSSSRKHPRPVGSGPPNDFPGL